MSKTFYGRLAPTTPGDSAKTVRIHVEDGHIAGVETGGAEVAAATGTAVGAEASDVAGEELIFVPGFLDLHNHGAMRGSFPTASVSEARAAVEFHRRAGTTTMLASLVSGSEHALARQLPILKELVDEGILAGVHLEGPFVNPCRCGAQDPAAIVPGDPEMFARLIEIGQGTVRSITFAPETTGAEQLLELCARHNIIASLGHTDADFMQTTALIQRGRELGVTMTATHLFNAMPPIHHRAPGAAAALLAAAARGEVDVELVADAVHLADGTVDTVLAAAGEHAFFITDAMQAAGMPDGDYTLGTLDVVVAEGVARLKTSDGEIGSIAGGTSTLGWQFGYHLRRGVDWATLIAATSTTPARVLGTPELGTIAVGAPANFVGLTPTGEVALVVADGEEIS